MLNYFDGCVGLTAATGGINVPVAIVLGKALVPCPTAPILWAHAFACGLQRSNAAVKADFLTLAWPACNPTQRKKDQIYS